MSDGGHGLDPSCPASREAAGSPVLRALWGRSAHGASRVFMILPPRRWKSGAPAWKPGPAPEEGSVMLLGSLLGKGSFFPVGRLLCYGPFLWLQGVCPQQRTLTTTTSHVCQGQSSRGCSAEPWPLPLGDAESVCSRFHVSRLLRFGEVFGRLQPRLTPRCPERSWLGCVDRGTRSWKPRPVWPCPGLCAV